MFANQYQSRPVGYTGALHQPYGASGAANSGQSGQSVSDKKWGDTTSRTGEISRVFVGGLDYKSSNCSEIEQRFSNYGPISGIDINQKNFAFVQFNRVEDAQNACVSENQSMFKGRKIEVRLFDKSGHPTKGKVNANANRERSRSPMPRAGGRPVIGPTGTRHGTAVNQFDDPYAYGGPPAQEEPMVGNEAEIIVINREQWSYADLIEKRIKAETGIQFIDMLFLHTPSSLNLTLNDLFERQTLYALVIAPVNEEHRSITLHVLHNQTEHRNMPLEDALQLIGSDFSSFTGCPLPPKPITNTMPPPVEQKMSLGDSPYLSVSSTSSTQLPENVSFLLRTVLQENGPKFLTISQIDVLIDYFKRQKSLKETASAIAIGQTGQPPVQQSELDKQKANLLDNPHVQAALSSLIQIGALTSSNGANQLISQSNSQLDTKPNIGYPNTQSYGSQLQNNGISGGHTLRHPLLGTELPPNKQQSIPGAPGGLVRYPPPQTYNQYNYQF